MRILVIGSNYSTESIANCLASDQENLVFTNQIGTLANSLEYDIEDIESYKDFALSNEIELTILCDENAISLNYTETFEDAGLAIFAPDLESSKIAISRANAKRFLYKNRIQTPKFGIFDKIQPALDWARAQNVPIIVNADCEKKAFKPTLCNTFPKAKKAINNLFEQGCKQIVLEVATDNEGKNFTFYVISDGFNAIPLALCAHENNKAFLNPNNVNEKIIEIANNIISSFAANKKNYVGILGIDFKFDTRENLWIYDFVPFFKELDADLFSYSIMENKASLFESALVGSLLDNYHEIEKSPYSFVTTFENQHFYCVYGRTLNEAKNRMQEVLELEAQNCLN
ncbi:MAG: hypothetical protein E7Z91_03230 [Cyanobacteria bacterium SIG30]|nr:hypothetical protein [Cyanobacteria bacterium SIG30]